MTRMTLVTDPLPNSLSVQYKFTHALVRMLSARYELTVASPYVGPQQAEALEQIGGSVLPTRGMPFSVPFFSSLRRNPMPSESMVWLESWAREALLGANARAIGSRAGSSELTLNISSTVAAPADLWWYQGPPLDVVIAGMQGTNVVAQTVGPFALPVIAHLDTRLLRRMRSVSTRVVANSPWIQGILADRGIATDGFVPSFPDLSPFSPKPGGNGSPYVLMYLGKETDKLDWQRLHDQKVNIVTFGAKRAVGDRVFQQCSRFVEHRGRVSDAELVDLYSNALVTLVPFTQEGLGWVPIESMACGTPVLTYDRQGPGYTVLDGQTGWLCQTADEMVSKTIDLWAQGTSGELRRQCLQRARQLSLEGQIDNLCGFLDGGHGPEKPAAHLPSESSERIALRPLSP